MLEKTLRLIRIANDMKSKEVAEKCGASTTYISEIENGNKTPSLQMLKAIAEAYNIPASTLMLLEEEISDKNLNYQEGLLLILDYYVNGKVPNANYKDQNADTKIKNECIKK